MSLVALLTWGCGPASATHAQLSSTKLQGLGHLGRFTQGSLHASAVCCKCYFLLTATWPCRASMSTMRSLPSCFSFSFRGLHLTTTCSNHRHLALLEHAAPAEHHSCRYSSCCEHLPSPILCSWTLCTISRRWMMVEYSYQLLNQSSKSLRPILLRLLVGS
jgi:hypothetical protein